MIIETPSKFQVSGIPVQIDKKLNQAYVNAIKSHIELLEEKKRKLEYEFVDIQTHDFVNGFIKGLNCAIEQLCKDINQLE